MTFKTGLLVYGVVALTAYGAILVYLSVCIHRGELKLEPPPTDNDKELCLKAGAVASVFWPLTLVVLGVIGVVEGMHYLIGVVVRRLTRGKRAADVLRKAS